MDRVILSVALFFYRQMMRVYPRHFRAVFEEEMRAVFLQAAAQALRRGALPFLYICLRELANMPAALLDAQHFDQGERALQGRNPICAQAPGQASDPSMLDGRVSWPQAAREVGLLLVMGVLLFLSTYFPLFNVPHSRQAPEMIVTATALLSMPVFVAGLVRGLPRWASPSGGLLLGCAYLAAIRHNLAPFLGATGLAALLLLLATAVINTRYRPLPPALQRLGHSMWSDWARLSYGVYGALPLAIVLAFDDTHSNARTPFLALAVAIMLLAALASCRGRRCSVQMAALLAGVSLSLAMAVLDKAYFNGGWPGWAAAPGAWLEGVGWVAGLWLNMVILLLAPSLIGLAHRVAAPTAPT